MNITAADFEKLGFWEDDTPEEKITVYIRDNGCGMSEEDLPVALLRHATSKRKEAAEHPQPLRDHFFGTVTLSRSHSSKGTFS